MNGASSSKRIPNTVSGGPWSRRGLGYPVDRDPFFVLRVSTVVLLFGGSFLQEA